MKLFNFGRQEPDPDSDNAIEGERDLQAINKGVTLQNKITNWLIIGGVCLLAAFLLSKYYAHLYQQHKAEQAPPKDLARTASLKLPPLAMPPPEPATPAAPVAGKMPPMTSPAQGAGGAAPPQPPAKSPQDLLLERRLDPTLRFKIGQEAAGVATAATGVEPAAPGVAEPAKSAQPAGFAAVRAYMLPDPTLIMTKGTVIPCTVQPALDTTLSGDVTCIVAEDVRGADNKASLLDADTKCFGHQGGGVVLGQRRIGVIWSRCETPQHAFIDLDSPAADALGRPGIAGKVDNHFWDRFGAAIALSLISDIGPYLVATHQGGGNNNTTIAFPNLASGPQEVMTEVLKSTLDIPPTITAPQAARVLIVLRNDLDFRDVYTLEASK